MKLLLLLLPFLSLIACGSTNCPELVTYREGLHPLDEAIYGQLEQSTQDLITAGQRTQNDLNTVNFEVNQAESHYNTSKQGDTSTPTSPTTPTTQPIIGQ